MYRNQDEWMDVYKEKSAFWIHDENPRRPHALLASGKHSNGFFNSRLVIPDDRLMNEAASDLFELFSSQGGGIWDVQGFAGPQTGATKLAEFLSLWIATTRPCFFVSPSKYEENGVKSMLLTENECLLVNGQAMLLCEDVLTTGGSVDLAADTVTSAGGILLPFILVLVNRSGLKEVNGKKIIALIDRAMPIWEPEICPLCQQGSKAIPPKSPPEWALLNAEY